MKLHIFNPEHEMALACNMKYFTAPHTIQELRMNLGWIPALWAESGDAVLVDDTGFAAKASAQAGFAAKDITFVSREDVSGLEFDSVSPWGWNMALYTYIKEIGVNVKSMPDADCIARIRDLSSRRHTAGILPFLRSGIEDATCGESVYVQSLDDVRRRIDAWKDIVVKAPWSSSGRGIRYVDSFRLAVADKWIDNIIRRQGGVMVEPYYARIMDFGMEFCAKEDGDVEFVGLSLFQTVNGAYKGSLLATENEKMKLLRRYLPEDIIIMARERICEYMRGAVVGIYTGPFGVDMMVVAGEGGHGFRLHPCVEINLRRTMGHVALSFPVSEYEPKRIMQVVHNVNYQLKTSVLGNNYVETI